MSDDEEEGEEETGNEITDSFGRPMSEQQQNSSSYHANISRVEGVRVRRPLHPMIHNRGRRSFSFNHGDSASTDSDRDDRAYCIDEDASDEEEYAPKTHHRSSARSDDNRSAWRTVSTTSKNVEKKESADHNCRREQQREHFTPHEQGTSRYGVSPRMSTQQKNSKRNIFIADEFRNEVCNLEETPLLIIRWFDNVNETNFINTRLYTQMIQYTMITDRGRRVVPVSKASSSRLPPIGLQRRAVNRYIWYIM